MLEPCLKSHSCCRLKERRAWLIPYPAHLLRGHPGIQTRSLPLWPLAIPHSRRDKFPFSWLSCGFSPLSVFALIVWHAVCRFYTRHEYTVCCSCGKRGEGLCNILGLHFCSEAGATAQLFYQSEQIAVLLKKQLRFPKSSQYILMDFKVCPLGSQMFKYPFLFGCLSVQIIPPIVFNFNFFVIMLYIQWWY